MKSCLLIFLAFIILISFLISTGVIFLGSESTSFERNTPASGQ